MPSTRNRTLRSVRNGNRSSTAEGREQTAQTKKLRSSKDDEPKVDAYDKKEEHKNVVTAQDTELTKVTTTREQSSNGSNADSGIHEGRNSPQNDSNTNSWEDQVFDFLSDNLTGILDEDEVVSRMNRMVRSATQQFEAARSIMTTAVNDSVLFDCCCEEAQNQAVIDDLLKEIFGSITSLDRHPISWIKRTIGASGRRQKSKHGVLLGNTKRRLTRGMTKPPANTKSNEEILYDAVREIEREKGMVRRSERRPSVSSYNGDDEGNRNKLPRHKRRAIAEHSAVSSSKRSRHEERIAHNRPIGQPVLDLAALELSKQKILEKRGEVTRHNGDFESFFERCKKRLPSQYVQMGIVHRLPEWDEIQEYIHKINNLGVEIILKEQMKGPLTRFLLCEHFCSDLDKAWYETEKVNVTQRDAEGLPKTTCWEASKSWKQTRMVQSRRFSKRFIQGEINERNKYRQAVRFFQRHASLLDNSSFPYDVTKVIPTGTSVAAWNKTRQMLSRGTVVGHNAACATYSVDFGERNVTSQEVPDSQVATIGGPELLRSAAENKSRSLWGECGSFSLLDDTETKAQLLKELKSRSRFDPSQRPLLLKNQAVKRATSGANVRHVNDQVAERAALICLTDSVDSLLRKKSILLEHLEGFFDDPQNNSKGECYLWLKENCTKVDACLNTLLNYVEMFYGTAYVASRRAGQSAPILSRDGFKGAFDRLPDLVLDDSCKETGNTFAELSELSVDYLLSQVHPPISSEEDQKDTHFEDSILSRVCRILLSSSFTLSGIISSEGTTAISALINSSLIERELETYPPGDDEDDFMASAYSARREAISELTEAAALFHAEVALAAL